MHWAVNFNKLGEFLKLPFARINKCTNTPTIHARPREGGDAAFDDIAATMMIMVSRGCQFVISKVANVTLFILSLDAAADDDDE